MDTKIVIGAGGYSYSSSGTSYVTPSAQLWAVTDNGVYRPSSATSYNFSSTGKVDFVAGGAGRYVAFMGGWNNNSSSPTSYKTIDIFRVNDDLTLTKYTGSTLTLTYGKVNAGTVVLKDKYICGCLGKYYSSGWNYSNSIEVVNVIGENISQKYFNNVVSSSYARDQLAVAAVDNYIFLMGGYYNGACSYVNMVTVTENSAGTAITGMSYSTLSSLKQPRYALAAASAGDFVLAMGGYTNSTTVSDAVDVYKVPRNGNSVVNKTAAFNLTLSQARGRLAAASVGNFILAMGGEYLDNSTIKPSNVVDVFEVQGDTVVRRDDISLTLSTARGRLAAASAGNFILAIGGQTSETTVSNAVDVFEVKDDMVVDMTPELNLEMQKKVDNLTAASAGHFVLAMGGKIEDSSTNVSNLVDVYEVKDNVTRKRYDLSSKFTLTNPVYNAAAVSIGNLIVNIGGWTYTSTQTATSTVDIFVTTENGIYKKAGPAMRQACGGLAAAASGNFIVAAGGSSNSSTSPTIYNYAWVFQYNAETNNLSLKPSSYTLSQARYFLAAASAGNFILFMGGYTSSSTVSDVVDVFEVQGNTVVKRNDLSLTLSQARGRLAAASTGNFILAMGGENTSSNIYNTVDIFEVQGDTVVNRTADFNLTLRDPIYRFAATSVDNFIITMGGYLRSGYTSRCNVFELRNNGIIRRDDIYLVLNNPNYLSAAASLGDTCFSFGGGGPSYAMVTKFTVVKDK